MPSNLFFKSYLELRTDADKGISPNQGGKPGESVDLFVQSDVRALKLIDWQDENSLAAVKFGDFVRIRGIDRDPWLKYDENVSPCLFGVRGDPGVGSILLFKDADAVDSVNAITSENSLILCLNDPARPLCVDGNGRLRPTDTYDKAQRFKFFPIDGTGPAEKLKWACFTFRRLGNPKDVTGIPVHGTQAHIDSQRKYWEQYYPDSKYLLSTTISETGAPACPSNI